MFANTILNCGHMKWYWLLIRNRFQVEKIKTKNFVRYKNSQKRPKISTNCSLCNKWRHRDLGYDFQRRKNSNFLGGSSRRRFCWVSKTYSKSKTLRVKIKSSLIFCSRLTFGLVVLKNFRLRPWEGCLTLIMGVIFFLMLGITVIWDLVVIWSWYNPKFLCSIYFLRDNFHSITRVFEFFTTLIEH